MKRKIMYFAYGANMKVNQLTDWIQSVKVVARGKILNKKLVFNKKSIDGSGKANLIESLGDIVWGVLFEINSDDLKLLDKKERGYHRITVKIQTDKEDIVEAKTYVSNKLTSEPIPYDWYKELLITGAKENQLPRHYQHFLNNFPSKKDARAKLK